MQDIVFEELKKEEIEEILHIYNYYVLNSSATFHKHIVDLEEMKSIVFFKGPVYKTFAIKNKGNICGYVLITTFYKREGFNGTAEVSIYLDHRYKGKGIGRLALDFIEEYAKSFGLHSLVAIICSENTESIRLFETEGYNICGHYKEAGTKFGRKLDVLVFQKILGYRDELNVLNGQAMYDYFKAKGLFKKKGAYIPFNEAMCVGDVTENIFSESFTDTRIKTHNTNWREYNLNVLLPLQGFLTNSFSSVTLWFDEDMFCQINLLTLLAYLDQSGYVGKVTVNMVRGSDFSVVDTYFVEPDGYKDIYTKVMLERRLLEKIDLPPVLENGIRLYLDYKKEQNEITEYINENKDSEKDVLVRELIDKFSDYGLGDLQYIQLIDQCRKSNQ